VGSNSHFSVVSGLKFTGLFSLNVGGIDGDHVFPILDIWTRSGDIRNRSLKLSEIAPNFACFWCPISLGEGQQPYCDHVAKFRGDRPMELGGSPANKKKTSRLNIRPSRTTVPGGAA